jgi:hypothetical protein
VKAHHKCVIVSSIARFKMISLGGQVLNGSKAYNRRSENTRRRGRGRDAFLVQKVETSMHPHKESEGEERRHGMMLLDQHYGQ